MSKKYFQPTEHGRLGKGPALTGPEAHSPHWWDRGMLPHVESPELTQHVTFHLLDALPLQVVLRWKAELDQLHPSHRSTEKRRRLQAYLDAGHGSCALRDPRAAELTQRALLHFQGARYLLHAWCIMPNHVHVLFQTLPGWTMSRLVWSWKSYTGRLIGQLGLMAAGSPRSDDQYGSTHASGAPNKIWHRDYFDRYMRDRHHLAQVIDYIHHNPVQAGLVERADAWPWSSAYNGAA